MAALPDVCLDLRASNEIVDLAEAGVDLSIRSWPLDGTPGQLAQSWFRYPWVVCGSRDYLARRGCPETPAELVGHELIGFRNRKTGAVRPWRFRAAGSAELDAFGLARSPLQPRVSIDDGDAVWGAALRGAGLAMAPLWLAAEALIAGKMVEVLRLWRGEATQVSILRRDHRHSPKRVEAVIAFLREHTPAFPVELYESDK
jgi:DNA-binding transcriptional LysR family regulator